MNPRHYPTIILFIIAGSLPAFASAQSGTTFRFIPTKGQIQYKIADSSWQALRGVKYLVDGDSIKTGQEASGRLYFGESFSENAEITENSEIIFQNDRPVEISGRLDFGDAAPTTALAMMSSKFRTSQLFLNERRGSPCDEEIFTVSEIQLSANNPELIWQNGCEKYSYRLIIDNRPFAEIAPQESSSIVRYSVTGVEVGEHTYRVEVLERGRTRFRPATDSTFIWLTPEAASTIESEANQMVEDVFLAASIFEENGFYTRALDLYEDYFEAYPFEYATRPLLISLYATLGLNYAQSDEIAAYNSLKASP